MIIVRRRRGRRAHRLMPESFLQNSMPEFHGKFLAAVCGAMFPMDDARPLDGPHDPKTLPWCRGCHPLRDGAITPALWEGLERVFWYGHWQQGDEENQTLDLGVGFLSVEKELDHAHQPTGQWKAYALLGDRGPYLFTKDGDLATAKALALQAGRMMLGQALDIVAHAEVRLDAAMDRHDRNDAQVRVITGHDGSLDPLE